jgi:hypothetical protein
MKGISGVAKEELTSQEGLCPTEFVGLVLFDLLSLVGWFIIASKSLKKKSHAH